MKEQQIQISPYAVLAAVLFNVGKTEVLRIKPDDSTQEFDVTADIISIEREGDAAVCLIPMERIIQFASQVYDCKMSVDGAVMLVTFEKRAQTSGLVTATGQEIVPQSSKIQELIGRLK